MTIRNTEQRWGAVHQTLHWLIVAMAIAQLTVGFIFSDLPDNDPTRPVLFRAHTTLGVTIVLVIVIRLLWRLTNPVPTLPDILASWQKVLAHTTHYLLYFLLIAMPIVGYLTVNAAGHPVPFFTVELPAVIGKSAVLKDILAPIHSAGAFVLIALVVLHAAAALRHEFLLKDNTLRRMTPLPLRQTPPKASGRT
ncbi:MAG: cytochrome b [Chromatiaceae bacterium]|jgi:superoxide oxidase